MSRRITVIRPGALGDVIVTRAVLGACRDRFSPSELVLVAPGERGRLLDGPQLADRVVDYDDAALAWIFSAADVPPPRRLREWVGGSDLVLAYMNEDPARLSERLRRLDCQKVVVAAPRPPENCTSHVHAYLCSALPQESGDAMEMRLPPVPAAPALALKAWPELMASGKPLVVLHPGSGGVRKNWPPARFAEVGRRLSDAFEIAVTSGEADGDLGAAVAGAIPKAVQVQQPPLPALASLLSHARLMVGNDSGVTHLAAAVKSQHAAVKDVVAIYGPTAASVWAPVGAEVVRAPGGDLSRLEARAVLERCRLLVSA